MNDLTLDMVKEIKQLENNIELNELNYKAKSGESLYHYCLLYF